MTDEPLELSELDIETQMQAPANQPAAVPGCPCTPHCVDAAGCCPLPGCAVGGATAPTGAGAR